MKGLRPRRWGAMRCNPNSAVEQERWPQMPMNTSFSQNGHSPEKGLGAFDPGLDPGEKASKGGGILGGRGFPSRPTLGLAKPTAEGWFRGESCGFGLAAHLPLPRRDPLRERLCPSARAAKLSAGRRRGRAPKGKQSVPSSFASGTRKRSPSQLSNRSLFFRRSTTAIGGITFPSRNLERGVSC